MESNYIQYVKMIYNFGSNTGLPPSAQTLLYLNIAKTLTKNQENPEIISSVVDSGSILMDRYHGKNSLHLENLKNNAPNSFYVLPLHSKEHAFSGVIKKVDGSYQLTIVDSNDQIKKYGFNDKKTLQEKLNQYMPTPHQEASTKTIKKDIENSASNKIDTPLRSKPQTIGNCYYIQIMKGIKVALTDDGKNKNTPQKTDWFKDGNKISTREFKMNLVEEFKNGMDEETKREIDKLTEGYKANKKISSLYKGLKGKLTPSLLQGFKLNHILNKNQNHLSMEQAKNVLSSRSGQFIPKKNWMALNKVLQLNYQIWKLVNTLGSPAVPKSKFENGESDRNKKSFKQSEYEKVKKSFETETKTNQFLKDGSILNQQLQEAFHMAKKIHTGKDSLNIPKLNLEAPTRQEMNDSSNLFTENQKEQLNQIRNSGKPLSERRNLKKQMGLINHDLKIEARRTQEKLNKQLPPKEKGREMV
jgi:hypothetical protein